MPDKLPEEVVARSANELQSRAISGSWWTLAHVTISLPIAFLANIIIARSLGPDPYGVLAALSVTLGLLSSFTNMGVSSGVIRFGSSAWARGDLANVDGLLKKSLGFHLYVQLPLMLIGLWAITRGQEDWVFPTIAVSVALPSALSSAILATTLENRSAQAARIAIVSNALSQLVISLVAIETNSGIAVWVTRALVGAILLPLYLLALDSGRRISSLRATLPAHWPRGFWQFTWPFAVSSLLGTVLFSRSEVLLLNWLNESSAAGIYALAYGIALQITAPIGSIANSLQAAATGFVAIHEIDQKIGFLKSLRLTSTLAAFFSITVIPLLALAIPFIYGEEFQDAALPFAFIGLQSCFLSAAIPFSVFLIANGESKTQMYSFIWATLLNLTLALVLIPILNIWGAIIANCLAQLLAIFVIMKRQSQIANLKPLEIYTSMRGIFIAMAMVVFALLIIFLLKSLWLGIIPLVEILLVFSAIHGLRKRYWGATSEDLNTVILRLEDRIRKPISWLLALNYENADSSKS